MSETDAEKARELLQKCKSDNASHHIGLHHYHEALVASLLKRIRELEEDKT